MRATFNIEVESYPEAGLGGFDLHRVAVIRHQRADGTLDGLVVHEAEGEDLAALVAEAGNVLGAFLTGMA